MSNDNAGERVQTRRKLRMARDIALTGAGVAGIAGAAHLTRKGAKAIEGLAKRGRAAVRATVKSSKGTMDTAKDVLEKNVRPAVETLRQAGANTVDATRIYADAGKVYGRAKANVRSAIPNAYREGVAEGMAKPRKKSFATRAGKIAGALGFESPYDKDAPVVELSSFVADVQLADLPREMRKTVAAFGATKTSKMPRYGMVVKELVAKADAHNLDAARKHVKTMSEPRLSDEFEAKRGKKFILLLNDQIIDGHHWLAKAEKLGITSALDVLDLTPVRFQIETQNLEALLASTNFAAAADDGKHERVKNALLYGTGGAYMGGLLAGGKPLRVPVPSKLIKKLGGRAGKGAWKKVSVNAARAGAAAGIASGLLMDPKKRKRGGVGDAIAEHAPGLVTATQAFGIGDLTGSTVRKAERMIAQRKATLGSVRNLAKDVAPQWKSRVQRVKAVRDKLAGDVKSRQSNLGKLKQARSASRQKAAAFVGGAGLGVAVGRRKKSTVEPMTLTSQFEAVCRMPLHLFGGKEQINDKKGQRVAPWDVFTGQKKGYVPDGAGKQRELGPDEIGHGQILRSVYNQAAPVAKWGGRVSNLAKDAGKAIRGEKSVDKAGREKKREWEKPWFQRRVKQAAVAGAIGAYGLGLRHNIKVPVPNALIRKVGAKAGKGFTKDIPLRDIHRGVIHSVKKKINQFLPDAIPNEAAAMLDDLMTRLESISERQIQRHFGSGYGYEGAYDAGWDVRDPRGKSARVFAPGSRKRERREKKWHEKIDNERKLWGAGLIAASLAGGAVGRKLARGKGGTVIHGSGNGSFTTSTGFRPGAREVTSSLR